MILKETIDFCRKIIKRFGSKEKVRIFAARFGKRGARSPPPRWESCLKDGPLEVGELKKVKKNFGGFEKVATFAAPFGKNAGSKKEDH